MKARLDEITGKLGVPRHFPGKGMKRMVKEVLSNSLKGHYGRFSVKEKIKSTALVMLVEITGEQGELSSYALQLRKCNAENTCPMHLQIESLPEHWIRL